MSNINLFTTIEVDAITKAFNNVDTTKNPSDYSLDELIEATRGLLTCSKDKDRLFQYIRDIKEKNTKNKADKPIVHNDSLTAWGNIANEKYALTLGDIRKMSKGDKLAIILLDSNVGDYAHGTVVGTKYKPIEKGCTYGTYTHDHGIVGELWMPDADVHEKEWSWELNLKAINKKFPFWGSPVPDCTDHCEGCMNGINHNKMTKDIEIESLPDNIKVGWRGPAITKGQAIKYLPEYIVHYGTWWDDYCPFRKMD